MLWVSWGYLNPCSWPIVFFLELLQVIIAPSSPRMASFGRGEVPCQHGQTPLRQFFAIEVEGTIRCPLKIGLTPPPKKKRKRNQCSIFRCKLLVYQRVDFLKRAFVGELHGWKGFLEDRIVSFCASFFKKDIYQFRFGSPALSIDFLHFILYLELWQYLSIQKLYIVYNYIVYELTIIPKNHHLTMKLISVSKISQHCIIPYLHHQATAMGNWDQRAQKVVPLLDVHDLWTP